MPVLFSVTLLGDEQVQAKLTRRRAPLLTATLEAAEEAAGVVMTPIVAGFSPVATGATRDSVSARHRRPGGVDVGPRTWYKHFVIGGTVRGIEPNPWVARGGRVARPAGMVAARRVVAASFR